MLDARERYDTGTEIGMHRIATPRGRGEPGCCSAAVLLAGRRPRVGMGRRLRRCGSTQSWAARSHCLGVASPHRARRSVLQDVAIAPSDVYVTGTDTGIGKIGRERRAAACVACARTARRRHEAGGERLRMHRRGHGATKTHSRCRRASDPRAGLRRHQSLCAAAATGTGAGGRATPAVTIELPPIIAAYRTACSAGRRGGGRRRRRLGRAAVGDARPARPGARARLPVVLVVGLRLGCINHARLTARAIAADGATCSAGSPMRSIRRMARTDDNFDPAARAAGAVPGRLPYAPGASAQSRAAALDCGVLLPRREAVIAPSADNRQPPRVAGFHNGRFDRDCTGLR